jgi:hypothetical protein
MPRLLPLLLLCLTLLTACKKDAAEPPALEGRWKLQSTYLRDYDQAGILQAEHTFQEDTKGMYEIFSADKISAQAPNATPLTTDYTREGNVLHLSFFDTTKGTYLKYDVTIIELTDTKLVYERRGPMPSGWYYLSGSVLTR